MSENTATEDKASDANSGHITALDDIEISQLRTTFFWPLTLEISNRETDAAFDNAALLQAQEKWLCAEESPWKRIDDGLSHLPLPGPARNAPCASDGDLATATEQNNAMALAYGEYTYFHDFVQRALFGKTGGPGAGPLRLFQRSDVHAVDVKFFDWDTPRRFVVERLNLYCSRAASR